MKTTYWSLKSKKTGELVNFRKGQPVLFNSRTEARDNRGNDETAVKVEAYLKAA